MDNNYSFIDYAPRTDAGLLDSYSRTITGVVGQVAEAVVHIQVQKPGNDRRSREAKLMPASGSGFIISTDGFVVTNNHVIEMAQDIKVSLADGRTVNAELKGADPSTDIAVLKIDVSGLRPCLSPIPSCCSRGRSPLRSAIRWDCSIR